MYATFYPCPNCKQAILEEKEEEFRCPKCGCKIHKETNEIKKA